MATFREYCFTPAEFARIAKIDRAYLPELERSGLIKTFRKKMGNVDRKMVRLEDVQEYFRTIRTKPSVLRDAIESASGRAPLAGRHGDQMSETEGTGAIAAGNPIPTEALEPVEASVAAATGFVPAAPGRKIQMFYNVKGGTGKSTLTAQYVMRAAMMGYRVLAIDLDGQGHLTVNLDLLDAHERPTVYDILINDLPIEQAVVEIAPGLDLIPGNLGLCNIEIPLNHKPRREYRLSEAIARVAEHYDIIVADTNPAASILNSSMLVAADLVNVVCATNPLSFHGMSLVMSTIEEMKREFRRELSVKIIPNLYDNREVISQEVLGELREAFPEYCTQAVINRSADLNEATKRRASVWEVNPKGTAAQDLSGMTEELMSS